MQQTSTSFLHETKMCALISGADSENPIITNCIVPALYDCGYEVTFMSIRAREWNAFKDLMKQVSLIVFHKLPLEDDGFHAYEIFEDQGLRRVPWLSVVGLYDRVPGHVLSLRPTTMIYYPFDEMKWDTMPEVERSDEIRKLRAKAIDYVHEAEVSSVFGKKAIKRSIEFRPEHLEAGVSILSYFSTIIRQKLRDVQATVVIRQVDLTVSLEIESATGEIEIIEKTLDDYGLVVTGRVPPESFASDDYQIADLKSQLRFVKALLESKTELIRTLDRRHEELMDEVKWLRDLVGNSLLRKHDDLKPISMSVTVPVTTIESRRDANGVSEFFMILKTQYESVRRELGLLSERISNAAPSDEEIQAVKDLLISIRDKDPKGFPKILGHVNAFLMNVAGSVWATVLLKIAEQI